jgi:hypothetical protein
VVCIGDVRRPGCLGALVRSLVVWRRALWVLLLLMTAALLLPLLKMAPAGVSSASACVGCGGTIAGYACFC